MNQKYYSYICALLLCYTMLFAQQVHSQNAEVVPYGDMDSWIVREIKESAIIGGNRKLLYELGPTDTIIGNTEYSNQGGSPWANSNVLAKVAGVVKTNTSVFPEIRGNGKCARLETRYESVKVLGIIDIEVIAAGALYLGKMHEPITGTKNPQSKLESGISFTKKPQALKFDYKVQMAPAENRIRSTGFSRKKAVEGKDKAIAILLLQKREEDEDGNVYAKRVGTMIQHYSTSTGDWINGAIYPIMYGDITGHPEYKEYMKIQEENRYTINSKGKNVPIIETGWAKADETPTHMIIHFASSHGGAYIGSPGNTLWIDNVALVY